MMLRLTHCFSTSQSKANNSPSYHQTYNSCLTTRRASLILRLWTIKLQISSRKRVDTLWANTAKPSNSRRLWARPSLITNWSKSMVAKLLTNPIHPSKNSKPSSSRIMISRLPSLIRKALRTCQTRSAVLLSSPTEVVASKKSAWSSRWWCSPINRCEPLSRHCQSRKRCSAVFLGARL